MKKKLKKAKKIEHKKDWVPNAFRGWDSAIKTYNKLLEQQLNDAKKPQKEYRIMAESNKDGQYYCPHCDTKEMIFHKGKGVFICGLCKYECEIAFKEKIK